MKTNGEMFRLVADCPNVWVCEWNYGRLKEARLSDPFHGFATRAVGRSQPRRVCDRCAQTRNYRKQATYLLEAVDYPDVKVFPRRKIVLE